MYIQVIAASTDSHFVHLAWVNTPRSQGGLGKMNIPIVADTTKQISRDYGVLLEGEGVALRYGVPPVCARAVAPVAPV